MQLDDLQHHWQRLDQKIEQSLALQTELLRRVVVAPARRRVNWLSFWPALDVAFCLFVLWLGAAILSEHWHDGRLLLPAGVLVLGTLALLIGSIRQLQCIAAVDWTGPVAQIQSSLGQLRALKIRQFKWIMLLSPLVGFCGFVAGAHGLLRWLSDGQAQLIDKLPQAWVIGNYIFGVVFALLGERLARVLAARCQHRSWWHTMLDELAGTSLKTATRDVEQWASLQRQAVTQPA